VNYLSSVIRGDQKRWWDLLLVRWLS